MDRNEIVARLSGLQLPTNQYVIVGGAAMAARGIRLRRLKQQYGRPKDLRDVGLLEDYLSSSER